MNKLLKITGYTFVILLAITIILIVIASLSQKKIVDVALRKISAATTVPIKINDLSFTLIKRFPNATFELSGVQIGQTGGFNSGLEFEPDKDILDIKSVFVLVKSIPLIKGEFEIVKLEIDGARLNYKVDSLGRSNIDSLFATYNFSKDTSPDINVDTTSEKSFVLDLKKIKLKNTDLRYLNDSLQMAAHVFIPDLEISGRIIDKHFSGIIEGDLQFTNEYYNKPSQIEAHVFIPGIEVNGKIDSKQISGSIEGDLQLTKCGFDNTNLNQMEEATFNFKLGVDKDTLRIDAFNANTEGAHFDVTGKAALSENLYANLAFNESELDFGVLQKYIPDELLQEYEFTKIAGKMNVTGTVKGNLSDSIVPAVNISFGLKNGNARVKNYPEIKRINFKGNFTNGNQQKNKTSSANFVSFHAETDSSKVDLSFSINNFDKPKYRLSSKLDLNSIDIKDLIPDSLIQSISGKISAEFSTQGTLPDSIDNNFVNQVLSQSSANVSFTDFNLERDSLIANDFSGVFLYSPGQIVINNLNVFLPFYQIDLRNSSVNAEFTGPLTESQHLAIHFKNFYFETPEGNVWGSGNIKNLENPEFVIDASAAINLDKLQTFVPDTLVKSMSGNLAAEINAFGKLNLDSIADQLNDIVFKQSKITLDAKNISITLPGTLQKLSDVNGIVKMEHDTISITEMSGIAAGIDFSIDSTTIVNAYKAVIKNQKETLFAKGNIELGTIDYSQLDWLFTPDSLQKSSISTTIPEPSPNYSEEKTENIRRNFLYEFKGKIAVKGFKYDKIFLEDCFAKFKVSDSVYIFDQFKANAFDGSTNSSVRIAFTADGKQIVNVKNRVDRMDLKKFLYAFDNFGQDSLISYENISGLFSTTMNSRLVFVADTLVTNDTRVMGDFTLENGRIINYLPAMAVAEFTGIKELDNIELKTVNSSIFFFKSKLYVPVTDVVSSSMDFSTFGMQSLGDDYEYHLEMHLRDALKGKSKKLFESQKKSGDEISKDDLDRNTVKIIYSYIDGKQKTGFDTKKAQRAMALKIQVQQKMLELIFHPQLVSFETDVK